MSRLFYKNFESLFCEQSAASTTFIYFGRIFAEANKRNRPVPLTRRHRGFSEKREEENEKTKRNFLLMAISYQGAIKKVSGEILSKYEVLKSLCQLQFIGRLCCLRWNFAYMKILSQLGDHRAYVSVGNFPKSLF